MGVFHFFPFQSTPCFSYLVLTPKKNPVPLILALRFFGSLGSLGSFESLHLLIFWSSDLRVLFSSTSRFAKPFFPTAPSDVSFLHSAFGNATCTFFPFFYYHFPPLNCIVLEILFYLWCILHLIYASISHLPDFLPPCYWINFPRSKLIFPRPTAMVGRRKNRAAAQPAVRTPSISTRSGRTVQGRAHTALRHRSNPWRV